MHTASKVILSTKIGLRFLMIMAAHLLLVSCTDSHIEKSATDSQTLQPLTRLSTQQSYWVNEKGEHVSLRGTNLGNWLLQEFWMMAQSSEAIDDQCTLEAIFDERFGFSERERLMDLFRDNWISTRDFDQMQAFGLNLVRLPFIWNLIEDEKNPYHLRADAWQYLDYAIDEAEARGMYVILDLHGAVGSQGWEHHSGCAGLNAYWATQEYQDRTVWLWQQIITRYKDRHAVAAYGLLNEPWGTSPENLAVKMRELYQAVRKADPHKIIVLPGHSAGIDSYGNPADYGMTNVAFEMHFYPGFFGWSTPNYTVHRDWLRCGATGIEGSCAWDAKMKALNAPLIIGEFQPWAGLGPDLGGQISRITYDTYAQFGWASSSWAYKVFSKTGGQGDGTWGMVTNAAANDKNVDVLPLLDFKTASLAEIEKLFTSFGTATYDVHEELQYWLTHPTPPPLFNLPARPQQVRVSAEDNAYAVNWQANTESDLSHYSLLRSRYPGIGYTPIASQLTQTSYTDTTAEPDVIYYYAVIAHNAADESYPSDGVATGSFRHTLPGKIEAESFSAMQGVGIENTTDIGLGINLGWLDGGDWVDYPISLSTSADYRIRFRVASESGSQGFALLLDGKPLTSQVIPATGGWQTWIDVDQTVALPQGDHTLRLQIVAGAWNLNWFSITPVNNP